MDEAKTFTAEAQRTQRGRRGSVAPNQDHVMPRAKEILRPLIKIVATTAQVNVCDVQEFHKLFFNSTAKHKVALIKKSTRYGNLVWRNYIIRYEEG
jgi:hypothetical protein